METGKMDRRRRHTLSVIREAFFALLAEVGFAKMTVADICRRADINRGTFYLHYEDKFALLDALIDEALAAVPPLEGSGADALCQRPPANDDYYLLYSDDDACARVAQRVVERGAEQMVPSIMGETGLSREDAYLLFVHNVQGNLAVNRLLGWKRGPEFAHAQELLNAYSEGGHAGGIGPLQINRELEHDGVVGREGIEGSLLDLNADVCDPRVGRGAELTMRSGGNAQPVAGRKLDILTVDRDRACALEHAIDLLVFLVCMDERNASAGGKTVDTHLCPGKPEHLVQLNAALIADVGLCIISHNGSSLGVDLPCRHLLREIYSTRKRMQIRVRTYL